MMGCSEDPLGCFLPCCLALQGGCQTFGSSAGCLDRVAGLIVGCLLWVDLQGPVTSLVEQSPSEGQSWTIGTMGCSEDPLGGFLSCLLGPATPFAEQSPYEGQPCPLVVHSRISAS